jgi:probable rRNA maturation factor
MVISDFEGTKDENDADEKISFFSEDLEYSPPEPQKLRDWISRVLHNQNCRLENLSFIFCSDNYLHQLNVDYLKHDDLTDVITFPYQAPPKVEGDIFISVERVRENAGIFGVAFEEELHRVMIHGVLHLCGFGDKTPEEINEMRLKEDEALTIF